MKTIKSLVLLIILAFNSCTIVQEYHFNKDFSGTSKLSIDMGSFIEMMAGMDSTGNSVKNMRDSLNLVFDENAQKLKEFGIKNIKLGWKDSSDIMYMSYDFDNLESLNQAINSANAQNVALTKSSTNEPHTYFSKNGKTLIYKSPKTDKESPKEMESMSEYYQYQLIFTFDRKVKKVDNPNVTVSKDKKSVELKGNMFQILHKDFNSDITFNLK
jgi:hypothetical protein